MDPAARALARLRDPEGHALHALARLVVEETTATPLRDIASPRWVASQLATALQAATRGDLLRTWVDLLPAILTEVSSLWLATC